MKYYIIAGEASGDLHGSNLIKAIKQRDPEAEIRCWGGDLMKNAGATLVKHYSELAFMGVTEVVKNLRTIMNNMKWCKQDIQQWKPDAVVLIDYAGFNLRMAEFAKKQGFSVFFYISPKVWVWKKSRIKKIKKFVDRLFVILPFEVEFFKKHNYSVTYVGNPLVDAITEFKATYKQSEDDFRRFYQLDREKPLIALLAGSRKQEVDEMLPVMIKTAEKYPEYEFVLAAAGSLPETYYDSFLNKTRIKRVYNKTYELLSHTHSAIVTSGTATLETGIFNVPEVVVYRTNPISYRIAMLFVNITYISLVNLIMTKEVVKEIIQFNLEERIKREMERILHDKSYRDNMLNSLCELNERLGAPGASERTAEEIIKRLHE